MGLVVVGLLLAIVGPSLCSQGVRAQNGGRFATSLCAELITPIGYFCTEHQVVTDDGFILGIQNMPSPGGETEPINVGPSVFLMHGVLAGGDNWVVNKPQESLAFILADAGFNVWIGNNRATQWSHGHINCTGNCTLSGDAYWAWTYDELASYDLVALTGYVYNQTGETKLTYIGHSQGTLLLLAGLTGGAFKTQILGYLNAAVLLAPVAFVAHVTPPIVAVGLRIYADEIMALVGNGQFAPNIYFNITCTSPLINSLACNNLYTGVLGNNSYLNTSRLAFYSQYYPQPTSSFNVNHYGQSLRSNTFQFYDKGPAGNLAAYGTLTPPTYDLTTFPTSLRMQLWTGGIDGLADPTDVNTTLSMLPSSNISVNNVANYGHVDFIYGYMAYVDVYPDLIKFLNQIT